MFFLTSVWGKTVLVESKEIPQKINNARTIERNLRFLIFLLQIFIFLPYTFVKLSNKVPKNLETKMLRFNLKKFNA